MSGWPFILLAYLLGCIPTGVIVARIYGVDLRSQGSGNIGATNAMRVIGKKAGAITLLGDVLKGTAGVLLAMHFAGREAALYAAGAAVLGHDFPVFLKFRGGKGVATSLGVLLALDPAVTGVIALIWASAVALWKYSSLGALVSFASLPLVAAFMRAGDRGLLALSVFLTLLIYIKHVENIRRLVKGEESRVRQRTQ